MGVPLSLVSRLSIRIIVNSYIYASDLQKKNKYLDIPLYEILPATDVCGINIPESTGDGGFRSNSLIIA